MVKGAIVVSSLALILHPSWIQAADAENPLTRMKNAALSRVNAAQELLNKPVTGKKTGAATEIRDKWGVFIGISQYADPTIIPMKFASKNASALSDVFKNVGVGRYAPDHVLALGNAAATKAAIESNLTDEWLCKKALPEDLVVLYICTRFVANESGQDIMLLANDTKLESATSDGIPLTQLLTNVKRRLQSKRVVAILDVSPVAKRKATVAAAAPAESAKQPFAGLDVEHIARKSGVTVLSATTGKQRSQHSVSAPVSSFTQYFIDSLTNSAGTLPLAEIALYVSENVNREAAQTYGKLQTPLFIAASDNPNIADVPLGVKLKSSSPPKTPHFGHPLDQLAMHRPDIMVANPSHVAHSTDLIAANYVTPDVVVAQGSSAAEKAKPAQPATKAQAPAKPPTQEKSILAKEASDDDNDDSPPQRVDMAPYLKEMKKQIQSKWTPPKGMLEKKVVSVFSIRRNGTIEEPTIIESSGTPAVDESALAALKAASPLPKLPAGSPQFVQVRYQFDWKVKPSSSSQPPAQTPAQ